MVNLFFLLKVQLKIPSLLPADCGYLEVCDDHETSDWSTQVGYSTLIGQQSQRPVSIDTQS